MLVWISKFVHLTAISLWAGGLMALPFLLHQKRGQRGAPLHRLHHLVRRLYVGWLSPAAFLGIASGVVLIFLQETFTEWFTLKLVFVGLLAALHVRIGLLILSVFDPGGRLGAWPAGLLTGGTIASVCGILVAVLWKPVIPSETWAPGLFEPGALGEMWPRISAWVTQ